MSEQGSAAPEAAALRELIAQRPTGRQRFGISWDEAEALVAALVEAEARAAVQQAADAGLREALRKMRFDVRYIRGVAQGEGENRLGTIVQLCDEALAEPAARAEPLPGLPEIAGGGE